MKSKYSPINGVKKYFELFLATNSEIKKINNLIIRFYNRLKKTSNLWRNIFLLKRLKNHNKFSVIIFHFEKKLSQRCDKIFFFVKIITLQKHRNYHETN